MADNALLSKITNDAAAQADDIIAAAEREVAEINNQTKHKIQALQTDAKRDLDKKVHQRERVAVSQAQQAGKIALQTAKRKYLDRLFTNVFTELTALPAAE